MYLLASTSPIFKDLVEMGEAGYTEGITEDGQFVSHANGYSPDRPIVLYDDPVDFEAYLTYMFRMKFVF